VTEEQKARAARLRAIAADIRAHMEPGLHSSDHAALLYDEDGLHDEDGLPHRGCGNFQFTDIEPAMKPGRKGPTIA
jgi:hypothetical protein